MSQFAKTPLEDILSNTQEDYPWNYINTFLREQRKSTFISLTHIRLTYYALITVSILLSIHSSITLVNHYNDIAKLREYSASPFALYSILFSLFAVLIIFVLGITYIYSALAKSFREKLHNLAEAVEYACKKLQIEKPASTDIILMEIAKT